MLSGPDSEQRTENRRLRTEKKVLIAVFFTPSRLIGTKKNSARFEVKNFTL